MQQQLQSLSQPNGAEVASATPQTTADTNRALVGSSSSCNLPPDYRKLYLDALTALDQRISQEIVQELDAIGLPPLADTLLLGNILDFHFQVFEEIFGWQDLREEWINVTEDILDISEVLHANFEAVIGNANGGGNLNVVCDYDEDAKRFKMDLTVQGFIPALELSSKEEEPATVPQVTFLPHPLPSLDMTTIPTLEVSYQLELPVSVDLKLNKFTLGETRADLRVKLLGAGVEKELPILGSGARIEFTGALDVEASFAYSSISTKKWSSAGSFVARLDATTTDGTGTANLGVLASDEDMFDSKPRKYLSSLFLNSQSMIVSWTGWVRTMRERRF